MSATVGLAVEPKVAGISGPSACVASLGKLEHVAMGHPFDVPGELPLDQQRGETFVALVNVMRTLLGPDGCPWDRDQTFASLRKYVVEEACEVVDAIDGGDRAEICEELGDLALQVVFLAELGRAEGAFGPDDVARSIVAKLVRRHPHVFSEGDARTPEEVEAEWALIKAREKRRRPLLDDIPRSLPALDGARRVSERVGRVGFDWPDHAGSRRKIAEELAELDEAVAEAAARPDPKGREHVEHELGDLLFAVVNYARHLGIDPEGALRATSNRFRRRFEHVERRVKEEHGDWPRDEREKPTRGVALAELDGYWNEAKEQLG